MPFTDAERAYLGSQMLGRLATVGPDGVPQNNPVGYRLDPAAGTIEIGGYRMGATRKFHNVETNGNVAFVVDEIVSTQPWHVRGVEVRGHAEAVRDQPPLMPGFTGDRIRIHPRRILSWGLDSQSQGVQGHDA